MIHKKSRIHYVLGFAAALLLACSGAAWCDEEEASVRETLECIGAYGGEITGVVQQGHYLYLAQGSTLRALDIADPERPREGGFVKNDWPISRMILNGPALYLVIDREGVGVRVVDISDPMRPRRRGDFGGEGYNLQARLMGSFLGVGDASKLGHWYKILDVSDPLRPKPIFSGDPTQNSNGGFVTGGKRIFFGERIENEKGNEPYRYRIIDGNTSRTLGILSQPLKSYGSLDFRIEDGELVAGDTETTATIPLMKAKKGEHFWASCDLNLGSETHDVNGAALEGWWGDDDEDSENDKALEPDARRALDVYADSLQFMERVTSIKVADKKGYASDGEGTLTVLDLGDPARPRGIGRLVQPGLAGVEAVEDNLAFDCDLASSTLRVIDCARPEAPRVVGTYQGALGPMVSSPTRLYVAAESGLNILDISNPAAIKELGKFPTPEPCTSLATSGTLVFLYANDLYVVDVANSAMPKLVNKTLVTIENESINGAGRESYLLKKLGNYLYLTASGDDSITEETEFIIVDVSNPAAPRVVADDAKNKPAAPPRIEGWLLGLPSGYRTTFDRSHGVRIYDLADPERPRKIGYFNELLCHPTVLYKNLIYLADGENGLVILKRSGTRGY